MSRRQSGRHVPRSHDDYSRGSEHPEPSTTQLNKLFVGGLAQETTKERLRDYFRRYGRITDVLVMYDNTTGRSRGFGFVTFDNPATVREILDTPGHRIDGKEVECKYAAPKEATSSGPPQSSQQHPAGQGYYAPAAQPAGGQHTEWWASEDVYGSGGYGMYYPPQQPGGPAPEGLGSAPASSPPPDSWPTKPGASGPTNLVAPYHRWPDQRDPPSKDLPVTRTDKIFVGGLPDLTTQEFREYFQRFGDVVDAILMFDKRSNRPRGFGFIRFASPEVVDNVIERYTEHRLKGKWVEVKKALPRENFRPPSAGASAPRAPHGDACYTGGAFEAPLPAVHPPPPLEDHEYYKPSQTEPPFESREPPQDVVSASPYDYAYGPDLTQANTFPSAPWNRGAAAPYTAPQADVRGFTSAYYAEPGRQTHESSTDDQYHHQREYADPESWRQRHAGAPTGAHGLSIDDVGSAVPYRGSTDVYYGEGPQYSSDDYASCKGRTARSPGRGALSGYGSRYGPSRTSRMGTHSIELLAGDSHRASNYRTAPY